MSVSYDEPRALPARVESITEDLLGLAGEVRDDLPVLGMLLPSERPI